MKKHEHIQANVPTVVQAKMLEVANMFDMDDIGGELVGDGTELSNIDGVAYSGYVPFQNGGFGKSAFLRNCIDSSFDLSIAQTTFNQKVDDAVNKEFRTENNIGMDDELTPEQEDELTEYEQEYWDEALARLYVYENKGQVHVELRLCYRDAPYYREKYDEVLVKQQYNYPEFGLSKTSDIINAVIRQNNKRMTEEHEAQAVNEKRREEYASNK